MNRIKVGDEVQVLTGRDAGARGKVVKLDKKRDRVIVENVNIIHRHLKPNRSAANPRGGIVTKPGGVHVSNVMLVHNERATRVGTQQLADGRRVRVARANGEMIDQD
jgi:large subunit ribosomal protein L24